MKKGRERKPIADDIPVVSQSKPRKRIKAFKTPQMTMMEFARRGVGKVAYINVLTTDEAKELFPAVDGLPEGKDLFSLHAADGTPLVLTDSHEAAMGHAMGDDLEVARVH